MCADTQRGRRYGGAPLLRSLPTCLLKIFSHQYAWQVYHDDIVMRKRLALKIIHMRVGR